MGRPRKRQVSPENRSSLIIAYIRVSTAKQVRSGLGLDAQQNALRAELLRQGVDPDDSTRVLWLVEEGKSAKKGARRPEMDRARELLGNGQAGALMATKVDRVSRSLVDFIELMQACEREGWRLVLTSIQLDTSTATGRLMARLMAELGEFERDMISERTSEALQAKKASGARLGLPERLRIPDSVRVRIEALREDGYTYQAICDDLKAASIPTARGGSTWYPSTIQAVLDRAATAESDSMSR
jgi:DNA invertase Pin-like site-specific DNA recombinase